MIESCEDVNKNAKDYKIPTLCFLAGQEKVVSNEAAKDFLKISGVPVQDKKLRLYANSYHNIHNEVEYKNKQRAEIYEWFNEILETKKPASFDKNQLKTLRFGRAPNKASAKVKRTIVEVLILDYLWWGLLFAIIRSFLRRVNGQDRDTFIKFIKVILLWP